MKRIRNDTARPTFLHQNCVGHFPLQDVSEICSHPACGLLIEIVLVDNFFLHLKLLATVHSEI